MNMKNEDNNKM